MAQTLKSLKRQMENVHIDGFVVENYRHGDYGYNIVYGTLDDAIEVGFEVRYHRDKDANAENEIAEELKAEIEVVRAFAEKLSPPGTILKKFIEGEILLSIRLEYNVDGTDFEFRLERSRDAKQACDLPVLYSPEQFVKVAKKTVNDTIDNLRILQNTKDLVLEKIEHTDKKGERNDAYYGAFWAHIQTTHYKITAAAYGVTSAFLLPKDKFAAVNMKRKMKKILKDFKKQSQKRKKGD